MAATTILVAFGAGCGTDGGAETVRDDAASDPATPPVAEAANAPGSDRPQEIPLLTPVATFPVTSTGELGHVAFSPNGTRVAITSQEQRGQPITVTVYDVAEGSSVASIEVPVLGLLRLDWMVDGRLVAPDSELEPSWHVWRGDSLERLATLPLDPTCGAGVADRNTGAIYAVPIRDDQLCRVDTTDGSIRRSSVGVLSEADRFWVRSSTGEVVVEHAPSPDEAFELVTLDGTTLTAKSSLRIEFVEVLVSVAATAWINDRSGRNGRLEPGAVPVEGLGNVRFTPSVAGTMFVTANGAEDIQFVSAADGRVLGRIPAGMNNAYEDWSIDDRRFVRVAADRTTVEVYEFETP
ncbi:MAG: hypothetical protein KJP18_12685 [Gemmatimonadetes bacterium]|nr:hypothetical protein [Gemmatimonadota bacterium]NNK65089.1 hypothetical protein [Gemmatimonadota bacterium]